MRLSFSYRPSFTISLPFGVSIGLELPSPDPLERDGTPFTDARLLRINSIVEQVEGALGADDLARAVDRLLALADEFPVDERREAILISRRIASLPSARSLLSEEAWLERKERFVGEIADAAATYQGQAELAREVQSSALQLDDARGGPRIATRFAGANAGRSALWRDDEREVVRCDNVGWRVDDRWILRNVSLELGSGSIVGIVGENGVGKTTLLRLLVQELQPTAGSIAYPGLGAMGSRPERVRDRIAYVPQTPTPYSGRLDVALRMFAALQGLRGQVLDDEVAFVMERFQLAGLGAMTWHALSGGFRTRFELARAVLTSPDLIVLDEPLGPLDAKAERDYLRHLRDLADSRRRACILLTSQDLDAVSSVADYIVVIKDGGVRFAGSQSEIELALPQRAFEFAGRLTMDQLSEALLQLPEAQLQELGAVRLLTTSPTVTAKDVLALLMAHGENLTYFRDLSQSPQRLIETRDTAVS